MSDPRHSAKILKAAAQAAEADADERDGEEAGEVAPLSREERRRRLPPHMQAVVGPIPEIPGHGWMAR